MIRWSIYIHVSCHINYTMKSMYCMTTPEFFKTFLTYILLHIFLNIQYKEKKFSKGIDEILLDGRVSQIIDLRPSLHLMKCRKLGSEKI